MIKPERLKLFTDALRADRFTQAIGTLTRHNGTPMEEHCVLGVACVVAMENGLVLDYRDIGDQRWYLTDYVSGEGPFGDDDYINGERLPDLVAEWYGFNDVDPEILVLDDEYQDEIDEISATEANDERRLSFLELADAFERTYLGDNADA